MNWKLITKNTEGKWETVGSCKPSDKGGYRIGINAPKFLAALTEAKGTEKGWGNFLLVEDDYEQRKQEPKQEPAQASHDLDDEVPF